MKLLFTLLCFSNVVFANPETRLALKRGGHLTIITNDWQVIDGSKIGENVEYLLLHKTMVDLRALVKAGNSRSGVPALKASCQGAHDTFFSTHRPYCQRNTPTSWNLEFVHVMRTEKGYVYVPYTIQFDGTPLQISTWKIVLESFAQLLGSRP